MKYFLFSILFCSFVSAQDLNFEDLENAPSNSAYEEDIFSEDELASLDIVDALTEQKEAVEKARTRILTPPPLPKKEDRPKEFRAVIPKDTILTRLSDDKDFQISRRIQVWAQEIFPGSQTTHVLDKDKIAIFSARSVEVVPIEEDLKLTPSINPKITYDRKAGLKYSSFEKELKLLVDLNWEFESIAPNFWNQVFNQQMDSARADRLTIKTFYNDKRLPLKFGISGSYQNAIASGDAFEIQWTSLFIGPQISYSLWKNNDFEIELEAGAAKAFLSTARTLNEEYSPRSYEWGGAAKLAMDTRFGTFLAGVEYRTTHISLDQNTTETILTSQKETQSSASFSLGYRLGFNL